MFVSFSERGKKCQELETKEIAAAVKESLQGALIELVRQGRDVHKAGSFVALP